MTKAQDPLSVGTFDAELLEELTTLKNLLGAERFSAELERIWREHDWASGASPWVSAAAKLRALVIQ